MSIESKMVDEKVNLVIDIFPLILILILILFILLLLAIFFALLVQQLREASLQYEKKERRHSTEKEPKEFLV